MARKSLLIALFISLVGTPGVVRCEPIHLLGERTGERIVSSESVTARLNDRSPRESVAERTARGQHFDALVTLIRSQAEPSLADRLAAARSAWALGLVARARQLWDEIFAQRAFRGQERQRAMLARSIMELQERRFEDARALAEQAAGQLEPSEIRAQLWLVIAEALKEQQAYSVAEGYYRKAVDEGGRDIKNEARFLLGECQLRLGMINEARYSFTGVEADSAFTAQALRRLVEVDLQQRNYEGVLTWITEGRETFPTEFREGALSYARITALTELKRMDEAAAELQELRVRESENNSWFQIADAAVEAAFAQNANSDDAGSDSVRVVPVAERAPPKSKEPADGGER